MKRSPRGEIVLKKCTRTKEIAISFDLTTGGRKREKERECEREREMNRKQSVRETFACEKKRVADYLCRNTVCVISMVLHLNLDDEHEIKHVQNQAHIIE